MSLSTVELVLNSETFMFIVSKVNLVVMCFFLTDVFSVIILH